MWSYEAHGVLVECRQGEITSQAEFAAVVNAANAELMPGGGVAGAIHAAAGEGLAEECRPHAPISPGEAIITGGHQLPNPHVIHCLGPVYGKDRPESELLTNCYRNALRRAEEKHLASIAFPAISTGAFGYPLPEAAMVTAEAISEALPRLRSVERIRFVLFDEYTLHVYEEVFAATFGG